MSRQINLYNPALLRTRPPFSALVMLQVLAVVALAAALLYGYMARRGVELQTQVAESRKLLQGQQAQLARLSGELSPARQAQRLEAELKAAESTLQGRRALADALRGGEMGRREGFSDYMRAFARQSLDGLWLTGFSVARGGADVTLDGRALRAELVPQYLSRLNGEPSLSGTRFASLRIERPAPAKDAAPAGPPPYLEFSLRSQAGEQKGGQ